MAKDTALSSKDLPEPQKPQSTTSGVVQTIEAKSYPKDSTIAEAKALASELKCCGKGK